MAKKVSIPPRFEKEVAYNENELYVTIPNFAEQTGFTRQHIHSFLMEGKIKWAADPIKGGAKKVYYLIPVAEVERFKKYYGNINEDDTAKNQRAVKQ